MHTKFDKDRYKKISSRRPIVTNAGSNKRSADSMSITYTGSSLTICRLRFRISEEYSLPIPVFGMPQKGDKIVDGSLP